ncbi:zf-HC2 domain-containing protein [Solihabitans fulvus]|uniref:Zf-HC2 domain-containing protein n=1 Tax=Solihabitans fulvus TaxID=1892852 RepID=A0A5B2XMM4_9PSEU|nr:zf-HC2 domain-containing protein [Solihabitans fulvus]KAA2264052.1 zf-HC2 domain-containing protein [Solihabitans fulvus]
MTDPRGWSLPEQHLLPDVVVAFVDGELSRVAHGRASAHLERCPFCAAEAQYQQQARAAVRTAEMPCAPANLLDNLRAIPQEAELPGMPDGLAVTEDGQLVTVLRQEGGERRGRFGSGRVLGDTTPLGDTAPLGDGPAVLGGQRRFGSRRTRHGAGVVVSGLMLGALALVAPHSGGSLTADQAPTPDRSAAVRGADSDDLGRANRRQDQQVARPTSSVPVATPVDLVSSPAAGGRAFAVAAR